MFSFGALAGALVLWALALLNGIHDQRALQASLMWLVVCAVCRPPLRVPLVMGAGLLALSCTQLVITPPAALILLTCAAIGASGFPCKASRE